ATERAGRQNRHAWRVETRRRHCHGHLCELLHRAIHAAIFLLKSEIPRSQEIGVLSLHISILPASTKKLRCGSIRTVHPFKDFAPFEPPAECADFDGTVRRTAPGLRGAGGLFVYR